MIRTLKCSCGSTLFSVVEFHRVPNVENHHALSCFECGIEHYVPDIHVDDENLTVVEEETPLDDEVPNAE